ncbi:MULTISPECIES: glycosyl hydrolase family 28 protein [unclassified Dysgonomonas]|jgi:hypothetical protein|uniref:glycosyl hydrolase family 28 protein n=1 Tax=unclassified Dysgonomonas TaxID=2630389 RepID=UPI0025C0CF82|nr:MULTISPECIES: glycosyl hydrolase family 28 protein [unclassified Dysgonomonas]MDR2002228.1 glycoside hydrolase [Prevotella sp.]HMM03360.1 glycosyl hydrolase family 28 protein [Dysgonomonas sp.]
MNLKSIWIIILLCFVCTSVAIAEIITYSVPKEFYYAWHNDDFTVKVRHQGEEWVDLFENYAMVDADTRSRASMVYFDFSGTVEVSVQLNNGNLLSAVIRPLAKGIVPEIKGNSITFTLDKPQNLSIEFNGDRLHNLHLFAGDIIKEIPDKNAPDIMYFEAGLHKPDSTGVFKVASNTTVFLEGGAVLNGKIDCSNSENVKIYGRGIIFSPSANGISADYCKNITVDGIIILNPRYNSLAAGMTKNITIQNIKSFSYQGWGDGLDFFCCEDVLVDGVFMRNSDDCIAVYNHRWDFYGDSRNIVVQNSTFWADIAHPINLGTHGNTETGDEVMENIIFRNIDILEHDEDDRDYQGCMAINVGDHNLARNIHFEDIRVENIQEGQLFHVRVMYNKKYNTGPGKGIENITFKNIYYNGYRENPSVIEGYDDSRRVGNISFENIVINGKRIKSFKDGNFRIGKFTDEITLE